jgi:hypothetical protein
VTRLYDVQTGAVTVDGIDVRDLAVGELRSAVAVVPQDTVLLNDTIRNNIRCGDQLPAVACGNLQHVPGPGMSGEPFSSSPGVLPKAHGRQRMTGAALCAVKAM